MKYVGKLQSKIFDQIEGQRHVPVQLGIGEVIKGWDVGVAGTGKDKRRLTIPLAMAYGKKGVKEPSRVTRRHLRRRARKRAVSE